MYDMSHEDQTISALTVINVFSQHTLYNILHNNNRGRRGLPHLTYDYKKLPSSIGDGSSGTTGQRSRAPEEGNDYKLRALSIISVH